MGIIVCGEGERAVQHPHAVPILFPDFGKYLMLMFLRMFLVGILLFGPAAGIAYVLGTHHRRQVLRMFPFLKGDIFRPVAIIWLFIAALTYFPALVRFWLSPIVVASHR
ncbi:MAG TPA: hypothetical protein VKT83_17255 [bacterium]|nr:hypothetical protein [bacterium]